VLVFHECLMGIDAAFQVGGEIPDNLPQRTVLGVRYKEVQDFVKWEASSEHVRSQAHKHHEVRRRDFSMLPENSFSNAQDVQSETLESVNDFGAGISFLFTADNFPVNVANSVLKSESFFNLSGLKIMPVGQNVYTFFRCAPVYRKHVSTYGISGSAYSDESELSHLNSSI